MIMFQQCYGSENDKHDAQVYWTGEISNVVQVRPQVDCMYVWYRSADSDEVKLEHVHCSDEYRTWL